MDHPKVYMAGAISGALPWRPIHAPWYTGPDPEPAGPRTTEVMRRCMEQIASCDVFLARVDRPDLHGTLVELGVAIALGKRVLLDMDPRLAAEMWFPRSAATDAARPPTDRDLALLRPYLRFFCST